MQPREEVPGVLIDQITTCEVAEENACFFGEGESRYCLDVDTLYRHTWNKKSEEPCSPCLQELTISIKEKVLEYKGNKDVKIFVSLSKHSYPLIAPYYRNVGDHIIAIVKLVESMGQKRNSKKESYWLNNLLKYNITTKVNNQTKSLYSCDLTKSFEKSWFSGLKPFKVSFCSIATVHQKENARKLLDFVNLEAETSEYYEIKFVCHEILGLGVPLSNSEEDVAEEDTSSSEESVFVPNGVNRRNGNYYAGVAIVNYLYTPLAFAQVVDVSRDFCQTRVTSRFKGYNTHNSTVASPYMSTVGEFYFEYINELVDKFQPLLLLLHMPVSGQRLLKLDDMTKDNNYVCIQHIPVLLDSWMGELERALYNHQVPANLIACVTTLTKCYTNIKSGALGVFGIFPKECLYRMLLDCAKNDTAYKMKTEDIYFFNIVSQIVNEIICSLDGQARYFEIMPELSLRLSQMGYDIMRTEECTLMGIAYNGSWNNVLDNVLSCSRYKLVYNQGREKLPDAIAGTLRSPDAIAGTLSSSEVVAEKSEVPLKIYVETVTEDLLLTTSGELVVKENIVTTVDMLNSILFDPKIVKQRKKALCNVLVSRSDIGLVKEEFLKYIVITLSPVKLSKLCNILNECEMTELNVYFLAELSKVCRG